MTIGPDPMTSTDRRSSRLGMRTSPGAVHQRAELVEQPGRVVRARRGLGVVLHAERRPVQQPQALDHAVVEVDVGDLGRAEVGAERRARPGPALRRRRVATAKPWLWLVMCTRPVARSCTGWFTPRCPNRSL